MPTRAKAAVVAVAVLAAACGDGAGESSAPTTSTTAAESTTSTAARPAEQDKAAAQSAVLTIADVGDGFRPDEVGLGQVEERVFSACSRGEGLLSGELDRSVRSGFFGERVGCIVSEVLFANSEADAEKAFRAFAAELYADCLKQELHSFIGDGSEGTSVTAERLALAVSRVDEASRIRTKTVTNEPDGEFTTFTDFVVARKGRGLAIAMLTHSRTPWPDDEVERLTGLVADRMARYAQ